MEQQKILEELELVMAKSQELSEQLVGYQEEEKQLRERIAKFLGESEVRSMYTPNRKYIVSISTRTTQVVQDEVSVREFLKTRGLLEECLSLNLTEVKKFAKREPIPGMGERETEVLTVSPVKEKTEQEQPEESDVDFRSRIRDQR